MQEYMIIILNLYSGDVYKDLLIKECEKVYLIDEEDLF